MDLWTSKSLTESHFQSADKEIADTINKLIDANKNEMNQNFKLERLFLIQKLFSFQAILKNVAIHSFNYNYDISQTDGKYLYETQEIKEWLWHKTGQEKLTMIESFIETEENSESKEKMTLFYNNAIKPFLNDFRTILESIYDAERVNLMLYDVQFISFH